MKICAFCLRQMKEGDICPECGDYKGISEAHVCRKCGSVLPVGEKCDCKNPKPKPAPFLELTNPARVAREARAGIDNYIPRIHGRSGWTLEEEGGVTQVSTRNLSQAIRVLGKVETLELVPEGVLFLLEEGAFLATGFMWGYRGEGSMGLAKAIVLHTDLAEDLDGAMKLVSSWPRKKSGVIWGCGDEPLCSICQTPADAKGGCEDCRGRDF